MCRRVVLVCWSRHSNIIAAKRDECVEWVGWLLRLVDRFLDELVTVANNRAASTATIGTTATANTATTATTTTAQHKLTVPDGYTVKAIGLRLLVTLLVRAEPLIYQLSDQLYRLIALELQRYFHEVCLSLSSLHATTVSPRPPSQQQQEEEEEQFGSSETTISSNFSRDVASSVSFDCTTKVSFYPVIMDCIRVLMSDSPELMALLECLSSTERLEEALVPYEQPLIHERGSFFQLCRRLYELTCPFDQRLFAVMSRYDKEELYPSVAKWLHENVALIRFLLVIGLRAMQLNETNIAEKLCALQGECRNLALNAIYEWLRTLDVEDVQRLYGLFTRKLTRYHDRLPQLLRELTEAIREHDNRDGGGVVGDGRGGGSGGGGSVGGGNDESNKIASSSRRSTT